MALETLHVVEDNKEFEPFQNELSELKKEVKKQKKSPEKWKKNDTNKEVLSEGQQQENIAAFREKMDAFIFANFKSTPNGAANSGENFFSKDGKSVYLHWTMWDGGETNLQFKKWWKEVMSYSARTHQDQNGIPGRSTSIIIKIGKEEMKYTKIDSKNSVRHNNYKLMNKVQQYFKEIKSTCQ